MSKNSAKQRYEQLKEWLAVFNKGKNQGKTKKYKKGRRNDKGY